MHFRRRWTDIGCQFSTEVTVLRPPFWRLKTVASSSSNSTLTSIRTFPGLFFVSSGLVCGGEGAIGPLGVAGLSAIACLLRKCRSAGPYFKKDFSKRDGDDQERIRKFL